MRLQKTRAVLATSVLLLAAWPSGAQDPPVVIHGFVSQGYLNSSANNYAGAPTERGTFEFNEVGVNFTANPVPNLRVAAQLFARDLGAQGNHKVTVDWALGDYRARDWLGIRAGRIKLPVGLYNTLRDVDMARAEVLQPAAIYAISQRDLLTAFDGASLYGSVKLGQASSLDYEGFFGTMDISDIYVTERFIRDGAAAALPGFAALGLKNASYTVDRIQATMDHVYGLALVWNAPLPGLRLGATFQSSKSRFTSDVTYSGTVGPARAFLPTRSESVYEIPNACVGSVEYARGGLKLTSEYYRDQTDDSTTLTGLPGPPLKLGGVNYGEAWYVQGSYRVNKHFQGQAYYSVYWPDRDDKDGKRYARQGQEFRAWSKDLALTARADVNEHWLLKVEFHRIDGAAGLSVAENPDGFTQKWNMVAVRTTLFF